MSFWHTSQFLNEKKWIININQTMIFQSSDNCINFLRYKKVVIINKSNEPFKYNSNFKKKTWWYQLINCHVIKSLGISA